MEMDYISSKDNIVYKKLASLRLAKYRKKYGIFVAEGVNLVREVLYDDMLIAKVDSLFVKNSVVDQPEISELLCRANALVDSKRIPDRLYMLADRIFDKLDFAERGQGVIVLIHIHPALNSIELSNSFGGDKMTAVDAEQDNHFCNILILDKLQDPGNVGGMIRTAEAAGFSAIGIIRGTTDVYSPKCVRASAGSVFRMPMLNFRDVNGALAELDKNGYRTVVGDIDGIDIYAAEVENFFKNNRRLALIIGNEGNGADPILMKNAGLVIRIPMAGRVESLNAGVAAALMMYSMRYDNRS